MTFGKRNPGTVILPYGAGKNIKYQKLRVDNDSSLRYHARLDPSGAGGD